MQGSTDSIHHKLDVTLNIYAGANFSSRTTITENIGYKHKMLLGSNFGIAPEIRIHPHIAIGIGAELSQKGVRMKGNIGDTSVLIRYTANYLDFPIYAKGIFGTGMFEEFFYLGSTMSYWASYNTDETSRYDKVTINHVEEDIKLKLPYPISYKRFDAAITLGGGCTVTTGIGKFLLDLRFQLGLANIYKSEFISAQHNRTFSLRFGYQLPLIK